MRMADMHNACMSASDRLKWARQHAGFASASDAARSLGVSLTTYMGHENGSRGFAAKAQRYARRYRVDLTWLMTGEGQPAPDYNQDEADLLDAYRKLPAAQAHAYLQLLRSLISR